MRIETIVGINTFHWIGLKPDTHDKEEEKPKWLPKIQDGRQYLLEKWTDVKKYQHF